MAISSLVFIPSAHWWLAIKVPLTGTELHKSLDAALDRWLYLCGRWVDERKYEDFSDYIADWAHKIVTLGGTVIHQMSNKSRPHTRVRFVFNLQGLGDVNADMILTAKSVKIEVIKPSDILCCGYLDVELGKASF